MADFNLGLGVIETGDFGNKFGTAADADGIITASFGNTGGDAVLTLTGFDIDFTNEVEVRLNGNALGFLQTGPNNGLNGGDRFSISASQQIAGTNTLIFEQNISDTYKWGVTDLLLSPGSSAPDPTPPSSGADFSLTFGQRVSASLGNNYNGQSDPDGVITASFEGSGTDARLSLVGFDVDFANEVEVKLNGNSLGFLSTGPNNGVNNGDSFIISAAQQLNGTNILTFEQSINNGWKWGVTDILIEEAASQPDPDPTPPSTPGNGDISLVLGATQTGSFGNNFDGKSDPDGVITATFANTGADATLSLTGFDVDFTNEVLVRLNGNNLGFLSTGPNNGLNGGDSFSISAAQQIAGTNTLTFEQNLNNGYKWGVTDILIENGGGQPDPNPTPEPPTSGSDFSLALGTTQTGSFGNNFDGQSDADGVVTATFANTGGGVDLSLTGFDVDFANEVKVSLNGTSLGFLSTGPNNGFNGGDSFSISAAQQVSGTNTLTFEQNLNNGYKWGVTDILLSEPGQTTPPNPGSGAPDGVLDVMIIGDSFSIPSRGLPGKVEAALEQRGYGETEIIDLTQSGRNIFGGRDAVLDHFSDPNANIPEVAILAIGINDALANRIPEDMDRVLGRTIDELQSRGVEVMLAVPEPFYPLKSGTQGWADAADQEAFRDVYDTLANENGLVIARDFLDGLLDNTSLLEGDTFHPNQAGTDQILANILPELEQIIDRALPSSNATTSSINVDDIVVSDGATT